MEDKKLKNKNLVLRILIFVATYNGIQAVRGFFSIRLNIGHVDDYEILVLAASLAIDYFAFLVLSVIVFVVNFIARKAVSRNKLIIRSIAMGIGTILIWYSAPSISYIIYMGASRYPDFQQIAASYPVDVSFIEHYISANLWTVFSYIAGAAIYIVLTVFSILSLVEFRKKKQEL